MSATMRAEARLIEAAISGVTVLASGVHLIAEPASSVDAEWLL
jgi:hypothetical protein